MVAARYVQLTFATRFVLAQAMLGRKSLHQYQSSVHRSTGDDAPGCCNLAESSQSR